MVAMGNERDVDIAYIAEAKDIRGLENPGDEVIVQIDTGDRTKHLRVMLNEAVLFDADPEVGAVAPRDMTEDEVIEKFGHLLNNTGGNEPRELLHRYRTTDNLAQTNIFVFTLGVSVTSQLTLLRTLLKEGIIS